MISTKFSSIRCQKVCSHKFGLASKTILSLILPGLGLQTEKSCSTPLLSNKMVQGRHLKVQCLSIRTALPSIISQGFMLTFRNKKSFFILFTFSTPLPFIFCSIQVNLLPRKKPSLKF